MFKKLTSSEQTFACGKSRRKVHGRHANRHRQLVRKLAASFVCVGLLTTSCSSSGEGGPSSTPTNGVALAKSPLGPRENAATIMVDDKMFVWGGVLVGAASDEMSDGSPGKLYDDGAIFNPQSNSWQSIPDGPLGKRSGAVAVETSAGILVVGGESSSEEVTAAAIFDPDSMSWTAAPDTSDCLDDAVWDGTRSQVLLASCSSNDDNQTEVLSWDLDSEKWIKHSSLPFVDVKFQVVGDVVVAGSSAGDIATLDEQDEWQTEPGIPGSYVQGQQTIEHFTFVENAEEATVFVTPRNPEDDISLYALRPSENNTTNAWTLLETIQTDTLSLPEPYVAKTEEVVVASVSRGLLVFEPEQNEVRLIREENPERTDRSGASVGVTSTGQVIQWGGRTFDRENDDDDGRSVNTGALWSTA